MDEVMLDEVTLSEMEVKRKNMRIEKAKNKDRLVFTVEGRLDTINAEELERIVKDSIQGIKELVFDLDKLEYISSSGLRVFLFAQKIMSIQGKMEIRNVRESVYMVFKLTGFTDIMQIEKK